MERRLREYLHWKARLHERGKPGAARSKQGAGGEKVGEGLSEAMKRKDAARANRAANRRRVRGGGPASTGRSEGAKEDGAMGQAGEIVDESDSVANLSVARLASCRDD